MKDATNIKSVKSSNQCQSVIQTSYDIVKAHKGEIKVETKVGQDLPASKVRSEFKIIKPKI